MSKFWNEWIEYFDSEFFEDAKIKKTNGFKTIFESLKKLSEKSKITYPK